MKIMKLSSRHQVAHSAALKKFESSFTYPLGEKTFVIQHGESNNDYFNFFRKLGDPETLVIENPQTGTIEGVGTGIYRSFQHGNDTPKDYWYLCDFKLTNHLRGKGVLRRMMLKYFLSFYTKSTSFVAVNMSPKSNNGLVKRLESLFLVMNIDLTPLYFYEWRPDTYLTILEQGLLPDHVLVTNHKDKDIVVDGKILPIIHIVPRGHFLKNLKNYSVISKDQQQQLQKDGAIFMYMTKSVTEVSHFCAKSHQYANEGVMISSGIDVKKYNISSLEI
ncbi:hypothetical protein [Neptuniibacter sp. QD37_11]|uniref:hypothetical protein n=1 Tax=Neptuniibacter sp. QD37_11 TaxID=3398209 RepID=UPI0039F63F5A